MQQSAGLCFHNNTAEMHLSVIKGLLTAACFDSVASIVLTAAKLFSRSVLFPFCNACVWLIRTAAAPEPLSYGSFSSKL